VHKRTYWNVLFFLNMEKQRRLPLRITLILLVVLSNTAWNVVRLWTGISWRLPLATYAREPGPFYVVLTGGAFAIAGSGILCGFWRRAPWAPTALLLGAWTYVLWMWADRLIFQAHQRANWPFAAVLTAAFLGWATAIALDTKNQAYLGREANEREFENHSSA
jgi:hypothetical protein